VLAHHHRRRVVHFNVTEHPTAAWTTQQLVDAFPDDSAPPYLLRDRDSIYGLAFRQRVKGMRIREVLTAPHSPWQNPFAERLIGSIRRECLDHVLVLSDPSGADLQTRRFLVVKDPAIKQRGASPASAAPALVSSPVSSRSRVTDPHGPSQSRELPDIVGRPADDRAMPLECGQARSYHRRIVVGPGSVP